MSWRRSEAGASWAAAVQDLVKRFSPKADIPAILEDCFTRALEAREAELRAEIRAEERAKILAAVDTVTDTQRKYLLNLLAKSI